MQEPSIVSASVKDVAVRHSIGLVVLDAANPFFTELSRGAEDRAAAEHFTVLVGNSNEDAGREAAYKMAVEHLLAGARGQPAG